MDNHVKGYLSRSKKEATKKFDSKRESLCEDELGILHGDADMVLTDRYILDTAA